MFNQPSPRQYATINMVYIIQALTGHLSQSTACTHTHANTCAHTHTHTHAQPHNHQTAKKVHYKASVKQCPLKVSSKEESDGEVGVNSYRKGVLDSHEPLTC